MLKVLRAPEQNLRYAEQVYEDGQYANDGPEEDADYEGVQVLVLVVLTVVVQGNVGRVY